MTLMHVQTVVVYTLSWDTGSLNCLTTGVTAGHHHKVLATRVRTETPNPATLSVSVRLCAYVGVHVIVCICEVNGCACRRI